MFVLLILSFTVCAFCSGSFTPPSPAEWALCPHQRSDAIECASRYADLNNDSYICWEEVMRLKRDLLTVGEKLVLFFTSPDLIMKHCAGPDDLISRSDFDKYYTTCLRDCGAVERFFKYFCYRAIAQNYKGEPVECKVKSPVVSPAKAHVDHKAQHSTHRVGELSSRPHTHKKSKK